MNFEITDSIFKVTGSVEGKFGTCFIIQKDEAYTYLLTCDHVIEDVGGPEEVYVNGQKAEVIAYDPSDGFDLAVLRVDIVFKYPSLNLLFDKSYVNLEDACKAHGFYDVGEQTLLESFSCQIQKETRVESSNNKRDAAWWLNSVDEDKLYGGFSGAPLFDTTNRVIGFVNQKKGTGERGLAISISVVAKIWPQLIPSSQVSTAEKNRIEKEDSTLINFKDEIKLLDSIISGDEKEVRLIALKGESGRGKSRLIREYMRILRRNSWRLKMIDLKKEISAEKMLDRLINELGFEHFEGYQDYFFDKRPRKMSREEEQNWNRNLNRKFFAELNRVQDLQPYFLILDHYEKADRDLKEWLSKEFLENINSSMKLYVLIGGQEEPQISSYEDEERVLFNLKSIPVDQFREFALQHDMDERTLKLIHSACKGIPSQLVEFISNYSVN